MAFHTDVLSLTSMPSLQAPNVRRQFDIPLAGCTFNGASVEHSRRGVHFACTISPVSDETLAALDSAARNRGTICLRFPKPLLLDTVTLERKGPKGVRIVGRIVGDIHHGVDWHL